MITLLSGLLYASAAVWDRLHDPIRFPVTHVKISGYYPHVSQTAIQSLLLPHAKQGFFGINISEARANLQNLPWVANATIKRLWPATILVKVEEQQPVATWQHQALLNQHGGMFTPALETFPSNLPQFEGPQGRQRQVLDQYRQMSAILSEVALTINQLIVTPRGAWQLQLTDGTVIELGRQNTLERLSHFTEAYQKIPQFKQKQAKVDMRYPNGMAVQWL